MVELSDQEMAMATRILVALHPGLTHAPALERARALSSQTETEVTLYSAVYEEHIAGLRFGDEAKMRKMREGMVVAEAQKLDEAAGDLGDVVKNIHVKAEWHYPASRGIVDAATEFGADLIIVSSTQQSAVRRWALTNTDWHVLRLAPMPVLFAHERSFQPYKTVLAAVDPTHTHDKPAELDHRIITHGRWFCDLFDGELYLGHAYPSVVTMIKTNYVPPDTQADAWRTGHARAVGKLAAQHEIDVSRVRLLDEKPRDAIPHLADELSADLVVIGVVSRSFLNERWIGRTAEHAIDHVECDVLAVRARPPDDQGKS